MKGCFFCYPRVFLGSEGVIRSEKDVVTMNDAVLLHRDGLVPQLATHAWIQWTTRVRNGCLSLFFFSCRTAQAETGPRWETCTS